MKKNISNLSIYHLIPLLISVILGFFILSVFNENLIKSTVQTQLIKGEQKMFRGNLSSCSDGNQSELELAGSLKTPESITIFGSSELGECTYSPYFFLPDSLHIPTVAFGHAFHQSFAMFCELLAMQKNLKNTKICILLSPGWFETDGTNIEAFLEFVRPNFLKSIIQNKNIPQEYKLKIGEYISEKIGQIEQSSNTINYLNNLYLYNNTPVLNQIIKKQNAGGKNIIYDVKTTSNKVQNQEFYNWKSAKNRIQKQFITSIKTNSFFINDEYYSSFLLDKHQKYKPGNTDEFNLTTNQELKDLTALIQLLKRYKCDASFVIQPLNPYHYKDLGNYSEIIHTVENLIKKNKFPILNLFITEKKAYEPGTLNDIMHLGDYGWMRVNEFLVDTYK